MAEANPHISPARTVGVVQGVLNRFGLVAKKASRARLIARTESHNAGLLLARSLVLLALGAFCLPIRLSLCVPPTTFSGFGLSFFAGAIHPPIWL